jgi:hypothetical protein
MRNALSVDLDFQVREFYSSSGFWFELTSVDIRIEVCATNCALHAFFFSRLPHAIYSPPPRIVAFGGSTAYVIPRGENQTKFLVMFVKCRTRRLPKAFPPRPFDST